MGNLDDGPSWTVNGVDPEAQEAANMAARRADITTGAWLNRVIRMAAAEELSSGRRSEPGGDARLPALPMEVLLDAIRKQTDEVKQVLQNSTGTLGERVKEAEQKAEKTALLIGPLERTITRLVDRLPEPQQMTQAPERRRSLLDRFLGR